MNQGENNRGTSFATCHPAGCCTYANPVNPVIVSSTSYAYTFDSIGNRVVAEELGTNIAYSANALNQYTNIVAEAPFTPAFDDDGSAPSEARRVLRGGSPRRVRISHPLVPSVGTMEEESNPNEVV